MNGIQVATVVQGREWQDRAVCQGQGDLFFAEPGTDAEAAAVQVCQGCPVRYPCLEWAMAEELRMAGDGGRVWRHGVFGGLTPEQRDMLWHRQAAR